jgi:Flp pilus assembly pilin Flp
MAGIGEGEKSALANRSGVMPKASLLSLLRKVHRDEEGAVSLETVLIVGAIALPILIFLIKVGWPRIKEYFNSGMNDLDEGRQDAVLQ